MKVVYHNYEYVLFKFDNLKLSKSIFIFIYHLKPISLMLSSYRIKATWVDILSFKGIVHFEIHFWYVSAYLKGIQDVS